MPERVTIGHTWRKAVHPSRSSRRPSGRSWLARLVLAAGLLVAVAGCIPASARPTDPAPPTPSPTPTPDPTPTPTPPPPTPTPAPTFALYEVKAGDSLTSIAKRFKTDGRSIAYWNRDRYKTLDPESSRYAPDRIKVGWTLQVLPGTTYVPPEDDGESGELYTPAPDDLDPEETEAPEASGSSSPAP
jgi:hypothetical protein